MLHHTYLASSLLLDCVFEDLLTFSSLYQVINCLQGLKQQHEKLWSQS
jgi:hypothetical protein